MRQSEALEIMKSGASVFLTGAPGAGKSYVLRKFVKQARAQGRSVSVTASTGIAAAHVNGRTIHSWAGVGLSPVLTSNLLSRIRHRRSWAIQNTDVLIIDEVSMIHAWFFDMIDQVCRAIRHDEAPFGGLQVIVSGDFFQLPPVSKDRGPAVPPSAEQLTEREKYAKKGLDPEGFITQSFAWRRMRPVVCYLTEQHRQDDGRLLSVLTHIRQGTVGRQDRDVIATRVGATPPGDLQTVSLFPHNAQADELNERRLSALKAEPHTFTATSTGDPHMVETLAKGMLAPQSLVLKEGAAVMALRNDMDGQYVNGSQGVVTGFMKEDGEWPVVLFDNGNEVVMEPGQWDMMDGDRTLASIKQVPLRCAWGITIHKSQGMTLDAAAMDLSRTFAPGMGYVALSRVERLDGLFIEGVGPRAYDVSGEASRLDAELRALSQDAQKRLAADGPDAFAADGFSLDDGTVQGVLF